MTGLSKVFLFFLFFLLTTPSLTFAADVYNNKFGIHILEPIDIERATELLNSNGGDWSFVTIVIRDDDQDKRKWQEFFDHCREKHLIPLVRIATHLEGNVWAKPKIEDVDRWVDFLSSFVWPVKNRYVIVFNEPNHAREWGGEINPQEYSQILLAFREKFKNANPNFKILNAGFDLAAPNLAGYSLDAVLYWQWMETGKPGIFKILDGWISHSYPNHGFIGTPSDTGRTSIRGYQWEKTTLKNMFGVFDLPIFITETGWPHDISPKSKVQSPKFYDSTITAQFLKQAFEEVWLPDQSVVAVTPFVLNYKDPPFDNFSWLDKDGLPGREFETIKNLPKRGNEPEQETNYEVQRLSHPSTAPTGLSLKGKIVLKNIGQSIWNEREPFKLESIVADDLSLSNLSLAPDIKVKPGQIYEFEFILKTGEKTGEATFSWKGLPSYKIKIFEIPIFSKIKLTFLDNFFLFLAERWYNHR